MAIKIGISYDPSTLDKFAGQLTNTVKQLEKAAAAQKGMANGNAEAAASFSRIAGELKVTTRELTTMLAQLSKMKTAMEFLKQLKGPFTSMTAQIGQLRMGVGLLNKELALSNTLASSKLGNSKYMDMYNKAQANIELQKQLNTEVAKQGKLAASIALAGGDTGKSASGSIMAKQVALIKQAQIETKRLEAQYKALTTTQYGLGGIKGEATARKILGTVPTNNAALKEDILSREKLSRAQGELNRINMAGVGAAQNLIGVYASESAKLKAVIQERSRLAAAQGEINRVNMTGVGAARDLIGIYASESAKLKAAIMNREKLSRAQGELNRINMTGVSSAQNLIGVYSAESAKLKAAIMNREKLASAQAALNRANMQGELSAQKIIGIQPSTVNGSEIAAQMKAGIAETDKAARLLQAQFNKIGQTDLSKLKLDSTGVDTYTKKISNLSLNMDHFRTKVADGTATGRHWETMTNQVASLGAALGRVGVKTDQVDIGTKKLSLSSGNLKYMMGGVARSLGAMTYSYAALIPLLTGMALGAAIKDVYKMGAAFEYAVTYVRSLNDEVGNISKNISNLDISKEVLAMDSRKGPQERIDGIQELAKAGVDVKEAFKELPELLNFATVAEVDMAEAVKLIVGQSMAFGQTFSDSANMIAAAAASSATDVQEMATAMSYTTELATVSGIAFNEVATAMAVMANAGIRGCYDDQTEVLTQEGWKLWKHVTEEDEFATYNDATSYIEYQKAERLIRYHHQGKMYKVSNKGIDLCVTPDHRMYVKGRGEKSYSIRKATEVAGRSFRYKTGGMTWANESPAKHVLPGFSQDRGSWKLDVQPVEIDSAVWALFLGWFLAEGHCSKGARGNYRTVITQKKTKHLIRMREVFDALPWSYSYTKSTGQFCFTSEQLFRDLAPLGKVYDKHIPAYAKEWGTDLLEILFTGLMDGDGCDNKYYTSSTLLRDDVQELGLKLGYATLFRQTITEGEKSVFTGGRIITALADGWVVSFTKKRTEPWWEPSEYNGVHSQRLAGSSIEIFEGWVDYDGEVFCAEVPNSLLIVRRKGRAMVSGNSKAGTALRTSIIKMQNPTQQLRTHLEQLGVSWEAFTSRGKVKSLKAMFSELDKAVSGLNPKDKVKLLEEMFGLRALKGGANVLRSMGSEWDAMNEKIMLSAEGTTFLQRKYKDLSKTVKAAKEELYAVTSRTFIQAFTEDTSAQVQTILKAATSLMDLPGMSGVIKNVVDGINAFGLMAAAVSNAASAIVEFGAVAGTIIPDWAKSTVSGIWSIVPTLSKINKVLNIAATGYQLLIDKMKAYRKEVDKRNGKETPTDTYSEEIKQIEALAKAREEAMNPKATQFATSGMSGIDTRLAETVSAYSKSIKQLKENNGDYSEAYLKFAELSARMDAESAKASGTSDQAYVYAAKYEAIKQQILAATDSLDREQLALTLEIEDISIRLNKAKLNKASKEVQDDLSLSMAVLQRELDVVTSDIKIRLDLGPDSQEFKLRTAIANLEGEDLKKYTEAMDDMSFSVATAGMNELQLATANASKEAKELNKSLGNDPALGKYLEAEKQKEAYAKILGEFKKSSKESIETAGMDAIQVSKYRAAEEQKNIKSTLAVSGKSLAEQKALQETYNKWVSAEGAQIAKDQGARDRQRLNDTVSFQAEMAKASIDKQLAGGTITETNAALEKMKIEQGSILKQMNLIKNAGTTGWTGDDYYDQSKSLQDLKVQYEQLGISAIQYAKDAATGIREMVQSLYQVQMSGSLLISDQQKAETSGTAFSYDEQLRAFSKFSEEYKLITAEKAQALKNINEQYRREEQSASIDLDASILESKGLSLSADKLRLEQTRDLALEQYAIHSEMWEKVSTLYEAELDKIVNRSTQISESISDTTMSWVSGLSSELTSLALDADASFSDILTSFLEMITEMMIKITVIEPMMSSLFGERSGVAGSTGTGLLGSLIPSFAGLLSGTSGSSYAGDSSHGTQGWAKGTAMTSPGLSAYSNSVVSKPTFFAKGGNVMGEAGPEGILPLTRTSSGNLGVEATGMGGGGGVNVVINNYGKEEVSQSTSTGTNGEKQIEITIGKFVKKAFSSGAMDGLMKQQFGVKRSAY